MKQLYIGRVVGINHEPARTNFDGLVAEFNRTPLDKLDLVVEIIAEPDNAYDASAVMVVFGNRGSQLKKIGYIPKPQNLGVLGHGIDKCLVEVVKLNKFDGRVVGLDIVIKGRESNESLG